jgi:hypothetical protein
VDLLSDGVLTVGTTGGLQEVFRHEKRAGCLDLFGSCVPKVNIISKKKKKNRIRISISFVHLTVLAMKAQTRTDLWFCPPWSTLPLPGLHAPRALYQGLSIPESLWSYSPPTSPFSLLSTASAFRTIFLARIRTRNYIEPHLRLYDAWTRSYYTPPARSSARTRTEDAHASVSQTNVWFCHPWSTLPRPELHAQRALIRPRSIHFLNDFGDSLHRPCHFRYSRPLQPCGLFFGLVFALATTSDPI